MKKFWKISKGKVVPYVLAMAMAASLMPTMVYATDDVAYGTEETEEVVTEKPARNEQERPSTPPTEDGITPEGKEDRPQREEMPTDEVSTEDATAVFSIAEADGEAVADLLVDTGFTWDEGETTTLTDDVELSSTLEVPADETYVLDLAGNELKFTGETGSVITVYGDLTIQDSSEEETGTITGGSSSTGGGIYIAAGGTVTMEGGSITGNTAEGTWACGGGVYLAADADGKSSEFIMTGGSITGNSAALSGGGIAAMGGTVTISDDATISDNTAVNLGGGVFARATFEMSDDAVISGNKSAYGGGVAVDPDYTFTMKGGSITDNKATSTLEDKYPCGGGVYLAVDGEKYSTFIMSGGSITKNTSDLSGGGVMAMAGSTLTMSGDAAISDNTAVNLGGGVFTRGTFTMAGDATISENTGTNNGGGVYVDEAGAFTMSGGSITGNKTNDTTTEDLAFPCGGGVYLASGSAFTMADGSIEDNTTDYSGGGVAAMDGSTFVMTGGTISGNKAGYLGGGVYVRNTSTFGAGTITGNTANLGGSGVYLAVATEEIENKVISMTLSTTTTISGNTTSDLELQEDETAFTLQVAEMTGSVGVYYPDVENAYPVTIVGSEADAAEIVEAYFFANNSGYIVVDADGSIVLEEAPVTTTTTSSSSSSKYKYIKVTVTGNGTVEPDGEADHMVQVDKFDDIEFEFTPDDGYMVSEILVDGKSVDVDDEYTFENVIVGHTLEVVFAKDTDSDDEDEEDEVESEVPFTDVDTDDDCYEGVLYVYEAGIMAGISDEEFGSEMSITRGMITAILYRLNGSNPVDAEMTFEDVAEDAYYAEAVRWAQSVGVVAGYSETEFAPNKAISNQEFVSLLYRYAIYMDMEVSVEDVDMSDYKDLAEVSGYAYPAFVWACDSEIVGEDSSLKPIEEALRGAVATALMYFMELA